MIWVEGLEKGGLGEATSCSPVTASICHSLEGLSAHTYTFYLGVLTCNSSFMLSKHITRSFNSNEEKTLPQT